MFRKPWNANKDGALETVMAEYDDEIADADEIDEVINDMEINNESE